MARIEGYNAIPGTLVDRNMYSGGGVLGVGQSFVGTGTYLKYLCVPVIRVGSPTGTWVAKVYTDGGDTWGTNSVPGTLLATSDTNDVEYINAVTADNVVFLFNNFYLTNGTHYVITVECSFTSSSSSNYIRVKTGNGTLVGNGCSTTTLTSWSITSNDFLMDLYDQSGQAIGVTYLTTQNSENGYTCINVINNTALITSTDGWYVDKNSSSSLPYGPFTPHAVLARASFLASQPTDFTGEGWRSVVPINGRFANANWTLTYEVVNNASYNAQTGYVKVRLLKFINGNPQVGLGDVLTNLTGWVSSSLISFAAKPSTVTGTITLSPGLQRLTNEYLFLEVLWQCVVSGGNNSAVVYLNYGGTKWTLTPSTFTEDVLDTVALNTTDAYTFTTHTPTIEFTGTDALSDDLEYEVQIDTVNTFDTTHTIIADQNITIPTSLTSQNYVDNNYGQTFTGIDGILTSAAFSLKANNYPAGTVHAAVYEIAGTYGSSSVGTGSPIATSDNVSTTNINTLGFNFVSFPFSGVNQIQLTNGKHYALLLVCTDGTMSTRYIAMESSSVGDGSAHAGNGCLYNNSTWSGYPLMDFLFKVYVTTQSALLDVESINYSGFSDTINSGDLHPFTSGNKVSYTIQTEGGTTGSSPVDSFVSQITSTSNFGDTNYIGAGLSFVPKSSYTISAIELYLMQYGTPTDNLSINLLSTYVDDTGTILSGSDSIVGSSINGWTKFTLSTPVALTAGTAYYVQCLRSGSQSAANCYKIYYVASGDGVQYLYIYQSNGWWNQRSTQTAGFKTYAMLGVGELPNNTYYYRVRAKDPTGLNVWGNWSATRNFIVNVSGGGGGGIINANKMNGQDITLWNGMTLSRWN